MNKIILMGRIGGDIELSYLNNENKTAVAKFSLAVKRRFAREGKQDTDWFSVDCLGKTAENLSKFFKKGDMIAIVGEMHIDQYEKDGQKRSMPRVKADEWSFCGGKSNSEGGSAPQKPKPTAQEGFYPVNNDLDDDLPF